MSIKSRIARVVNELIANEPKGGYVLSFSGGKDSTLLKHLLDLAKVTYTSIYTCTTGESEDFIKFLYHKCPDLIINLPKYTLDQLIYKYKYLPFNINEYCSVNCVTRFDELFKSYKIIISGFKDVDCKEYLDIQPFEFFGKKFYNYPDGTNEHTIFFPLIDWTDEEVLEAADALGIELYRSYKYGLKAYSCPFCHCSSKTKNIPLYPDLAEKWKGYAKYCWENNESIRAQYSTADAYWEAYIAHDALKPLRDRFEAQKRERDGK